MLPVRGRLNNLAGRRAGRYAWDGAARSHVAPREASTMATKKKATRPARKPAQPKHAPRQQPESLRLRSIAASFTVNDLQKSVAWYRDVLGSPPRASGATHGGLRGLDMKAG